ncbi:Zinc finger MYM-type protein 1 [Merluccius polli]|uniref:Zinc finger MYM-type protein 1 n=1 Tax=Merluccius polli TaxID=89951 RepID=A0AA47P6I6_MERPO|nr:Zinc finger MYM-type protein 1 [Merluccius polli]
MWLEKSTSFTCPKIQNEVLQIMSNTIVKMIVQEIKSMPVIHFSLIIDGTQDITGTEQESICIRYVDQDLMPREEFIGLYEVASTTGANLAKMATDVLTRLDLPISQLRGQTYDGASNMSGSGQGVQAILKRQQPLASYVHCGPHCVNLVTQATCTAAPFVRDALTWVHDLGVLFKKSGKSKAIFKDIAVAETGSYTTLKPLCPTRWTVRTPAVRAVLGQYECVLTALEEIGSGSGDNAAKARGLHDHFVKGKTLLGLLVAEEVMGHMEGMQAPLQHSQQTIPGMLKVVSYVKTAMQSKHTEHHFGQIYSRACEMAADLDLESIQAPHVRRPPKHLSNAEPHVHPTVESFYRMHYFNVLDTASVQLSERFDQESLHQIQALEDVLVSGTTNPVVNHYPELNPQLLQIQLAMLKTSHAYSSASDLHKLMKEMVPAVRSLFSQVEILLRILLVVPASSATAERSFSALRRLKNWLRTSMSQQRLNHMSVCHVHKERMDKLNMHHICQQWVSMHDSRRSFFGSFV